ncbi:hypothetical protein D3C71_1799010 [compost metagenome]
MYGHIQRLPQLIGEFDANLAPLSHRAVHVLWQTDDDLGHFILFNKAANFIDLTAVPAAFNGLQSLGCPAEGVAYGSPDPPVAKVKSQLPHLILSAG